MTRTFKIQARLKESSGTAILDIPHLAFLRYSGPEKLIEDFREAWGVAPEAVVLPVTAPDGLLFKVEGLGQALSQYAAISSNLKDFQDVVHAFAKLGLGIYLLIDPTLPFLRASALHLVDILGNASAQVCIGNPRTREILAAILGTGVDIGLSITKNLPGKLKGIVYDAVDLWPMGGKEGRLQLTCFCPSCEDYFTSVQPGLLRRFKTFPNPWNLVLKDSGTGISFIDDIRLESSDEDIVGLSRQKGFHEIFPDQTQIYLREQARELLTYIQVRHDQTIASIDDVFQQALNGLDIALTRTIVVEGSYYDWTSGLRFEDLDRTADEQALVPYDEVWFDPASTDIILQHVPFRSYMWSRSRYFIDAFLQYAGSASDPVQRTITGIARLSRDRVKNMLRARLNQALGTAMTGPLSLVSLPDLKTNGSKSQRIGFVGTALTQEVGERFIEGIKIPDGLPGKDAPDADIGELLRIVSRIKSEKDPE